MQRPRSEVSSLLGINCPVLKILKRSQQKTAGATCGIGNPRGGFRSHYFNDCPYNGPGREILPRSTAHIVGVFGKQPLIDFTLYVHIECGPFFTVYHLDEEMKFGRIVYLALRLGEDQAYQARKFTQFAQSLMIAI